jgi:hypothetical protein
LNDTTQILDEATTFSLSFGNTHGYGFLVDIGTEIARILGEAFRDRHRDKRLFPFPMPTNTNKPPSGSGHGKCGYTGDCSLNGGIFPLVANIFGRPPDGCPSRVVNQVNKDMLLQCDLVQNQVDKLKAWGGVVDWVVQFRDEHRLNIAFRNSSSLESTSPRQDLCS